METTAEFVGLHHHRPLTEPSRGVGTAADNLVHKRFITTALLSVGYLAVSVFMVAWLGPLVLPLFLVPFPLAMVLLWETADVLRSDEIRELSPTVVPSATQNGLDTNAEAAW